MSATKNPERKCRACGYRVKARMRYCRDCWRKLQAAKKEGR